MPTDRADDETETDREVNSGDADIPDGDGSNTGANYGASSGPSEGATTALSDTPTEDTDDTDAFSDVFGGDSGTASEHTGSDTTTRPVTPTSANRSQSTDAVCKTTEDTDDTEGRTNAFEDILGVDDTEPADPVEIDHAARRGTRITPERVDVDRLPNPFVECGCGDCPDRVDPLADECDGPFGDVIDRTDHKAAHECPDPAPVTVGRAATIYRAYQMSLHDRDEKTSRLDRLHNQHAAVMDSERNLLDDWVGEMTTALLSLRLSPVQGSDEDADHGGDGSDGADYGLTSWPSKGPTEEPSEGSPESPSTDRDDARRRWISPVTLDNRLTDGWKYVSDRLRDHLADYEWEYVWTVAATDSAATPHLHVYCWIRDPDDEITVDHVRPAVESFVRNVEGADPDHHPVEAGESDAAVVETDPPRLRDLPEEQVLHILHQRGDEGFKPNTAGLAYVTHQRPDWVLRRLRNGESDDDEEQIALEGAAIAWASPNDWIGSSNGINLSP